MSSGKGRSLRLSLNVLIHWNLNEVDLILRTSLNIIFKIIANQNIRNNKIDLLGYVNMWQ